MSLANDKKFIKPILKSSYQNQKEASKTLEKLGYTYDKGLSTNQSKVFVDSQGNPNIAFRGSKTARDWLISDPLLALGLQNLDPRFKEAKALTKKVEQKYGKPVDVFGHSLGGTLAENSGAKGSIITYNKGAGIGDIGKTIPKNQTDIRAKSDIVSALSLTQKHNNGDLINLKTPILQNPLQAHGLDNLDKLQKPKIIPFI
jgi:hypothetical protein